MLSHVITSKTKYDIIVQVMLIVLFNIKFIIMTKRLLILREQEGKNNAV